MEGRHRCIKKMHGSRGDNRGVKMGNDLIDT